MHGLPAINLCGKIRSPKLLAPGGIVSTRRYNFVDSLTMGWILYGENDREEVVEKIPLRSIS